ncbi:ABC transporter ATP-binding protein [Candidatus Njordibacter sp. Uisw_039]|jgi:phospholipid/cholesterol/gamma-HCH transport system ATP-binding protein|uniref:ABC transporter ATP-binding protein n=1 Tax=Candidatus Njordibacter sp. Uisw_039 TaxID=3230972 RepID=UPI003A475EA1|tara:strand:+ start:1237 stop:2043 length:807 start_codon:yes stop_codon:yes gene_type:complete
MATNGIINIRNVSFYRGDRVIFENLNCAIAAGKITAIMGPSGTGKTTLLRLIGGQLQPHKGQVLLFDQDIARLNRKQLNHLRARMGVLFQSGALFTDLSVFENVAFPLREHMNLSADELYNRVLLKLEAVGLRGARDLMPSQLSGGMARRVALARAVAMEPEIILYDEPFAGQDPIAMAVLQRLIKGLNSQMQLTSVLVSHDIAEACAIADQVILLGEGRVLAQDSPAALQASADPAVKQFIHGEADGVIPFHFPALPLQEELRGQSK